MRHNARNRSNEPNGVTVVVSYGALKNLAIFMQRKTVNPQRPDTFVF